MQHICWDPPLAVSRASGRFTLRFYTLDGATQEELSCHGWFRSYNFGSIAAARLRWQAAAAAGVDYIASDQYEQLAAYLKALKTETTAKTPAPLRP